MTMIVEKFIKKHFDMETLWAFDRLIPGAYKAEVYGDVYNVCNRWYYLI